MSAARLSGLLTGSLDVLRDGKVDPTMVNEAEAKWTKLGRYLRDPERWAEDEEEVAWVKRLLAAANGTDADAEEPSPGEVADKAADVLRGVGDLLDWFGKGGKQPRRKR